MSHIETVNVNIIDLEALKLACKRLGVIFAENQKTYTWFGQSVGDYPLPAGVTVDDLGKCHHAIRVPDVNYEIGVTKNKDGKGYSLLYDFYGKSGRHDGSKLKDKFSNGLTKLIDAYSIEALKRKARAKGWIAQEKQVKGKTHLIVTY